MDEKLKNKIEQDSRSNEEINAEIESLRAENVRLEIKHAKLPHGSEAKRNTNQLIEKHFIRIAYDMAVLDARKQNPLEKI